MSPNRSREEMQDWINRFEGLAALEPELRQELASRSQVVDIPEGTTVFTPHAAAENLFLVLDGTVRVQQVSEDGHEIVLYRVAAGDTCIMTLACLLGHDTYAAEGVTETATTAVAVPRAVFDDCMSRSAAFRTFLFSTYAERLGNLFAVINEVAFARIDVRLARRLLELASGGGTLTVTHQELAKELGTAREVVSRQLTEFRRRGWIDARRGEISILDQGALEQMSSGNPGAQG